MAAARIDVFFPGCGKNAHGRQAGDLITA
jgi:hypothetical protein